ncbi:YbaN family protein [Paracoccus spongiarum]|uniref:YbaN family protein n=1 Tax=Paracoccus spongiarum TaxID=3064387 RepID=A0ABT9JBD7_9RHOB|nr:YbaN family protein [Paracoccus sp. 2205BS29-5]MDP5307025.1 YbaN family protein [Paracoccus sp. 2205BS29-5]
MRALWLTLGCLALGLGILGIALPIMPTVPFLLVAAWAFARSSPRLRRRILEHPTYGPPVRAWQERGAVGRLAKIWAVLAMSSGIALALWLGVPHWVVAIQACICVAVSVYLVTRPSI